MESIVIYSETINRFLVGVMEFSAPEGIAYIPLSVIRSLNLLAEVPVTFTNIG